MQTDETKNTLPFLQGGGEMGELSRNFNWSETTIGTPGNWPQSLRLTVSIILNSRFPMLLWWGDDLIQFYNDAYRQSLGHKGKHPGALGQKAEDCWPETWSVIHPLINGVLSGGGATWSEDQLLPIYRNGKVEDVYWTFSYSPIKDESEKIAGVLVVCNETTGRVLDRKRQEQKANALHTMIMEAPVAMCIYRGPQFVIETANNSMFEFWGKLESEVMNKPLFEALPEAKNQGYEELLLNVVKTGTPFLANEMTVTLPRNGTLQSIIINFTYQPLAEADGTISGILAIAADVTEQVTARKKIEQSAQNLRNTILQAPVAMCIFRGAEFVVEIANERMFNLFGKEPSAILDKPIFEGLPEAKDQGFEALLQGVYTTGETFKAYSVAITLPRGGGLETFYLDFVYEAYREADGKISGVIAVAIDSTAQVIATKKIESSEARFRLLADAMPQMIWTGDAEGALNYFNQAVYDFSGLSYKQIQKDGWIEIVHPEEREENKQKWIKAIQTGEDFIFQHRFRNKHGEYRWQLSRAVPQRDNEGKINLWIGTSTDIHDQKLFEAELDKKVRERTEALEILNKELQRSNSHLEEFAHVASHDLKEPIRKIHYFTDRLKNQLSDKLSKEDERMFERVEYASQRMNSLIDDLLLYSHVSHQPHEKQWIDLDEKVKKILDDLGLDVEEKGAVILVHPLPVVQGYRRQLQQLFQNLLTNSLKYIKVGVPPQIEISATIVSGNDAGLPAENDYHLITVTDNGIGFEQEPAEKIFQMFQRLHGRNEYEGTGVGLSIVRKVVENHKGRIVAEGKPGSGATFKVYLPVN